MRAQSLLIALLLAGCSDGTPGGKDPEDTDTTGATDTRASTALGRGDGELEPDSIGWTYILGDEERLDDPRDLGFDVDGNLWIANRQDDRTFIVFDPGEDGQDHDRRKDGYAEHFMEETSAIAFESAEGAGSFGPEFGTCGESENTYNDQGAPNEFMGPVLWTADLDIFAEENPYGLGSHLDMLHDSPLCVGIAWERDSVYWVFDGFHDLIVRYDFQEDHNVGEDDHSDGIIYRLTEPELKRVEDAPGHMALDHETGLLYVADSGNGRILRLDTASGERGDDMRSRDEELEDYAEWEGTDWSELVTGLDRPGGLALGDGFLYVADHGTGILHVYDLDGVEVQSLDTGLGEGALYGIELGPDGRLWVTDNSAPAVYRLDPEET